MSAPSTIPISSPLFALRSHMERFFRASVTVSVCIGYLSRLVGDLSRPPSTLKPLGIASQAFDLAKGAFALSIPHCAVPQMETHRFTALSARSQGNNSRRLKLHRGSIPRTRTNAAFANSPSVLI